LQINAERACLFVDFDFFLIYFVYFVELLRKIHETHERRKQAQKKFCRKGHRINFSDGLCFTGLKPPERKPG